MQRSDDRARTKTIIPPVCRAKRDHGFGTASHLRGGENGDGNPCLAQVGAHIGIQDADLTADRNGRLELGGSGCEVRCRMVLSLRFKNGRYVQGRGHGRERSYLLKLASSMLSVCRSVCKIGVVS